jgi:hypothetical protein
LHGTGKTVLLNQLRRELDAKFPDSRIVGPFDVASLISSDDPHDELYVLFEACDPLRINRQFVDSSEDPRGVAAYAQDLRVRLDRQNLESLNQPTKPLIVLLDNVHALFTLEKVRKFEHQVMTVFHGLLANKSLPVIFIGTARHSSPGSLLHTYLPNKLDIKHYDLGHRPFELRDYEVNSLVEVMDDDGFRYFQEETLRGNPLMTEYFGRTAIWKLYQDPDTDLRSRKSLFQNALHLLLGESLLPPTLETLLGEFAIEGKTPFDAVYRPSGAPDQCVQTLLQLGLAQRTPDYKYVLVEPLGFLLRQIARA